HSSDLLRSLGSANTPDTIESPSSLSYHHSADPPRSVCAAQLFAAPDKPPFVAPGLKPLLQRTSCGVAPLACCVKRLPRKRRAALPSPRGGGLQVSERTLGRRSIPTAARLPAHPRFCRVAPAAVRDGRLHLGNRRGPDPDSPELAQQFIGSDLQSPR